MQLARGREKRKHRTPRVNWVERREDTKGHLGLLSCVHSPTRTTRAPRVPGAIPGMHEG